jgi:hypothetical protein
LIVPLTSGPQVGYDARPWNLFESSNAPLPPEFTRGHFSRMIPVAVRDGHKTPIDIGLTYSQEQAEIGMQMPGYWEFDSDVNTDFVEAWIYPEVCIMWLARAVFVSLGLLLSWSLN